MRLQDQSGGSADTSKPMTSKMSCEENQSGKDEGSQRKGKKDEGKVTGRDGKRQAEPTASRQMGAAPMVEAQNEWNHLLCLFNMSFSMNSCTHFESFLSQFRERIVIGAMSKRGQKHDFERWLTDGKSKTCSSGDAQSVRGGNFFTKFGISLVNPESDDERKRGGQAPGNWMLGDSKIGSRKFSSE